MQNAGDDYSAKGVTSQVGDKPTGRQSTGRQTNRATTNWATTFGQLDDKLLITFFH